MKILKRLRWPVAPVEKQALTQVPATALPVIGFWGRVLESFSGAWQRGVTVDFNQASSNWAVFAVWTLIAGDIGKMPARVMQYDTRDRIWKPTNHRPVLLKPNHFQTWPEFVRSWVLSLLSRGNAYVLKERDDRGFVVALYVLNPDRVMPLVAPNGDIYYTLSEDPLSGLSEADTVPASEIIHDRINTLWHPLVGLSPIYASGVAAMQGLAIQNNSTRFFQNMSQPGGVMTAPGAISDETANRLKESFQENFSGKNMGNLLVLGDGLTYQPMTISARDSQLIEQLKWTGEMICATHHVPAYKLNIGQMQNVGNVAALNQQYFDQCLHPLVDGIERRLDVGLELEYPFQVWLDTSELLRMDPATRFDAYSKAIGGGWLAPNEARRQEDLPPAEGGDSPMMQQQNYSLAALALRDARDAEASDDVQAQAMQGAQIASLQGLITAASLGQIPIETVAAAISAAFPLLTEDQIQAMVKPLEQFEPYGTEPPPSDDDPPPASDGKEEDPQEEAERFAAQFVEALTKELELADAA